MQCHSGWTPGPFQPRYENQKWFVQQANAAGTFIVYQAAGAFIVHKGNVVEQLRVLHQVERSSPTVNEFFIIEKYDTYELNSVVSSSKPLFKLAVSSLWYYDKLDNIR